ncbi:MAG TPA: S9 family peptidase, partial [Caulobacteraceae bacterium]|nr:S9 family peptidase [Caulobacteraceae bacterium]
VEAPTEAPAIAFIDLDAKTASYVGTVYDDLKPGDAAPVRSVAYKASDGTPLGGYLTLPTGRPAKNLPLIVFPHGGPASRDAPGLDWWAQAMASRGYAVLQVNYRGSEGFGKAFLEAGYGQWGRKMQTDLSDGVRYLAAAGTIDPKRVCIVGASYGGYAALAGATLDPGVYRCAVSVAGLSDLRRFVAWTHRQHGDATQRDWDRFMGAKGPTDPRLDEISPADHVSAATPPVLLIHGKDDTVVPFEQSQIMADALKRAGKPADLVVLSHEDHWLSRGETRLQMLRATMAFVEANNPPD